VARPSCVPAFLTIVLLFLGITLPVRAEEIRDILGATHAAGRYSFTEEDFLNEGADRLLALGTRVIKVWFRLDAGASYPFHSDWPPTSDLAELAQAPYYRALFAKPFTTYFLVIPPVTGGTPFLDGMAPAEAAAESDHLYRLARYLLTAYAGTGKTFVLQNWEGDHLLRQGLSPGEDPDPVRIQGMRDWWNARQDGVDRARREVGMRGVTVAHAAEVNLVDQARVGKITAVNDVVPFTRADLYSYSCWDVAFDRGRLTRALDYLAEKAPDSELYGGRNVYLGEFGAVPDQVGEGASVRNAILGLAEAALGWGARWVVYWQLYCNEAARPYEGRPANADLRGFWLIRPDGSRAPIWEDFRRRLSGSLLRVSLALPTGQLVAARAAGDDTVAADHFRPDRWTNFSLTDLNGGDLESGDAVTLQAHNGLYLTAGTAGDTGAVWTRGLEAGPAETFQLWKAGGGTIRPGDAVVFQARSGRYLAPGLASGELRSDRAAVGPPDAFRLRVEDD
jgi:hypothetical protein